MINYLFILNFLLSVFVLLCFIYVIYRPNVLKFCLTRILPTFEYKLPNEATEIDNYTIYHSTKNEKKRLLVWFNGGAFLFSQRKCAYGILNTLFEKLNDYDLLVFDYPVRFDYTLHDTMMSINKTLSKFLNYNEYVAVGMSAGTLLMGTFISKEQSSEIAEQIAVPQIGLKFQAFIGLNGVYNTKYNSVLLTELFSFYILRNIKTPKNYTCYNLKIPKLIINCTNDFLYDQTRSFLLSEHAEFKLYDNPQLTHLFPLFQNLPEAKDVIERIVSFVKKLQKN